MGFSIDLLSDNVYPRETGIKRSRCDPTPFLPGLLGTSPLRPERHIPAGDAAEDGARHQPDAAWRNCVNGAGGRSRPRQRDRRRSARQISGDACAPDQCPTTTAARSSAISSPWVGARATHPGKVSVRPEIAPASRHWPRTRRRRGSPPWRVARIGGHVPAVDASPARERHCPRTAT